MSGGLPTRHRSVSSSVRPTHVQLPIVPKRDPRAVDNYFAPCATTASLFLFSQGHVIICLHHDTLAVERRFTHHGEKVQFISVDNVSERGAGRLVVSYDVGRTAIVWDLFTGGEHARFAAFEPLQVAAWMRNGNVAFGKKAALHCPTSPLISNRQHKRRGDSFRASHPRTCFGEDDI